MGRNSKRRGISLGTVVMLVLTLVVLGGSSYLLQNLMGDTMVTFDAGMVLEAFSLDGEIPELKLSEIPIGAQKEQVPVQDTKRPLIVVQTPTPSPEPTATPYAGGRFTLTIGGSVQMDEAVRQSGYYNDAKTYDFTEIFSLLAPELDADYTMLSLENLTNPDAKVSTLNAPTQAMHMLTAAGVDLVALGFPTAYEAGGDDLNATILAAQEAGLKHIGAYTDEQDAAEARIVTLNNVSVGFLHYTEKLTSKSSKALKKAGASYALPTVSAEKAASDIAALRSAGAQVVVVSVNWDGTKTTPTKSQKNLAQQIADAGADVIVGTGTGIVQPIVWLEGGSTGKTLCAYSLGTLLGASRNNGAVAAMLLQLSISVDGSGRANFDKTAYTPTYIWRYKQDGKYYYRVVASDLPAPDGMDEDQHDAMKRALTNVQKYMGADSMLPLRTQ